MRRTKVRKIDILYDMKNKIIGILVVAVVILVAIGLRKDNTAIISSLDLESIEVSNNDNNSAQISTESVHSTFDDTCLTNNNPFFSSVTPNGGETYHVGQDIIVRWSTCHMNENALVGIMFTEISLAPANTIILSEGTVNDGRETFTLPTSSEGNYWMHIFEVDDTSNSIYSESSILLQNSPTPLLTVVSPNDGDVFNLNSAITVNWSSANLPLSALVRVSLQQIGAAQTHSFPLSSTEGTANDGQEIFYLPGHLTADSNYKISIGTNYLGGENYIFDESDSFFTIQ